ncbi:MAG: TRAP transporter small permease subunit [Motiliproteus sp.]
MTKILNWMKGMADNIAAGILAVMALTFVLQIISRYVLADPLGWTVELLLTLWLWLVFWAGAFCVKDSDHIRFDVLYIATPSKVQRIFAVIASVVIVVGFVYSFLPTIDYITFYKIKKSAIMKIRLDYVFSIYGVFIIAIVVRYSWRAIAYIYPPTYKKITDEEHYT